MSVAQRIRDSLIGARLVGSGGTSFHLRSLLGEGGQGWVYKANYDAPDGFWVVVKILRPAGINPDALHRFERETRVLQMLGAVPTPNPNIVRFYDHGVHRIGSGPTETSLPFLAIELVDGPNLQSVLEQQRGAGLPVDRSLRVMRQVARALHTVHERRIVHRDLKPSNILLAHQEGHEVAKITDFGLVKAPEISAKSTATIAGASLGYAPPEQYEMGNARVSAQTDIFSFGAILFELLSGRLAFPPQPGESALRTVARMMSGDRPRLASSPETLPRSLAERRDVVDALDVELGRALAADPSARHGSILSFWGAVEPLLREVASRRVVLEISDEPSVSDQSHGGVEPPEPSWSFSVVGDPLLRDRVRAAAFVPDTGAIYAVGLQGAYRFFRGHWAPLALPAGLDVRRVRGIARLRQGDLLLHGDAGLALVLSPAGAVRVLPGVDGDYNWLGSYTEDGDVVLAGERRSAPIGALAEVGTSTGQAHTLTGTTRLFGATRLSSGALLACGSHGDLVQFFRGTHRDVAWGRTGHLYGIVRATHGGAHVVGSGGHALHVVMHTSMGVDAAGTLSATLEAVQTTRDLWSVAVDPVGNAWAVGSDARVLERRGVQWVRIPVEGVKGHLVAVSTTGPTTLAVADDGTVIEGLRGT